MTSVGKIALGIVSGVILTDLALGLGRGCTNGITKNGLYDYQVIQGELIDEHYEPNSFPNSFWNSDEYTATINTKDGRKVVLFDEGITDFFDVPRELNGLFQKGDSVRLRVAKIPKDSTNNQKLIGLDGELVK